MSAVGVGLNTPRNFMDNACQGAPKHTLEQAYLPSYRLYSHSATAHTTRATAPVRYNVSGMATFTG